MAADGRLKLIEVLDNIKKNPNGMEEFARDPVGYLQRTGINADGLTLRTGPFPGNPPAGGEVSDADLAVVAGGGCFSLGYYACYSEG